MNKTLLAVAITTLTTGSVVAMDIEKTGYVGAELGGSVLFDNDQDFEYSNMFKAGGDVTFRLSQDFALIGGGEARAKWQGKDIDTIAGDDLYYVDRFQAGILTQAGKTTIGKQCGVSDDLKGSADLSKEYGLGLNGDDVACTDRMISHKFSTDAVFVGMSYDLDQESIAVGGTFDLKVVAITGLYSDKGIIDTTGYTLGAVAPIGTQLKVAAKFTFEDASGSETTGYAVSTDYAITNALSVAASYNTEDADANDKDDWFTVGAKYVVNSNLNLVTDYKLASESDDKLFLRANVNF